MLLAAYVLIQSLVPLRAYWPGTDSAWTGDGFNFAWRVMLAEKSGAVELVAAQPSTGRQWRVHTRDYVTERQERMMAQDPYMVRDLARHVAADFRGHVGDVAVYADAFVSLNGRPAQRIIDPRVDLGGAAGAQWILPR